MTLFRVTDTFDAIRLSSPASESLPVIQSHDDRSSMAMAMVWSSRVTTISLEMALPGVLGIWLDSRWGTSPILTVLGVIAGFSLGMLSLIKLAGMPQEPVVRRGDSSDRDSTSKKSTNQESK